MSNRLQYETSPYLLQHKDNPVDWYPWGEEAFRRAREEEKPVFLSIGYSTCHWCHVMAHESFEDEEVAAILNRDFISIKVDREERPDIDSIYMSFCQAFTGSGGWPTSIFMTPEQKPFFAGTYYPKHSRGAMMGFIELLTVIRENWDSNRSVLLSQADEIIARLTERSTERNVPSDDLLALAVARYKKSYDRKYGGFGRAPKFPTPHNILFLLECFERQGDAVCLEMAEHTLLQMYRGGLFDHIGYGFCRYSTDKYFLVPHFEKMLYDNAMLIMAYCRAYAVTKKPVYREIAKKTAVYVLREMTSPDGGFYSAQDADSDGLEGKYYVFTPDEITEVLGHADGTAFNEYFGITEAGNFEGKSIPNLLAHDLNDKSFDAFLPKLYNYRKRRCSLRLDDKMLTFWNSLMIAAMCHLYRISGDESYLVAAKNSDRFITDNLSDGKTLYVSYRDGSRGVRGFLDDYAGYIFAQLSLYDVTLERIFLERAEDICSKVLDDFSDINSCGFFLYDSKSEELILRPKETYDGAVPCGNSLMAWNLARLSLLTSHERYIREAERQMVFLSQEASVYPMGYAMFLCTLQLHYLPSVKITVVPAEDFDAKALLSAIPLDAAVVLRSPSFEFPLKNEKTTFYICRGHTCLPPTNDLYALSNI